MGHDTKGVIYYNLQKFPIHKKHPESILHNAPNNKKKTYAAL